MYMWFGVSIFHSFSDFPSILWNCFDYPSETLKFNPLFPGCVCYACCSVWVFCVVFCRSVIVFMPFLFWPYFYFLSFDWRKSAYALGIFVHCPFYWLSFFDLQLLITTSKFSFSIVLSAPPRFTVSVYPLIFSNFSFSIVLSVLLLPYIFWMYLLCLQNFLLPTSTKYWPP